MKLSNKLLIIFAVSLIVLPLLGMIYHSQVYYKPGAYSDVDKARANNDRHFEKQSANMTSKPLASFHTVNIADALGRSVDIQFIKDDKFGVKIPADLNDAIGLSIDINGQLQIVFQPKVKVANSYVKILIYGPSIQGLNIAHANSIFLNAQTDSLSANLKNSGSVELQRDMRLSLLRITTEKVKSVEVQDAQLKSLDLNLNGTNFQSDRSSYDELAIKAAGKSEIEIVGSYDKRPYLIKNLFIQTLSDAEFKLEGVKVNECSGSFSDQTKVQMPAINLNQMFNNKN